MAAPQDNAQRIIMLSSPEPKSENLASRGVMAFASRFSFCAEQVMFVVLTSISESIAKKVSFSHLGNDLLVIWCVIANILDPLFCYILVVDQQKNCVGFDKNLRLMVVILRSLIDFVYILLVVYQFRIGDTASAADKNNGGFCSIPRRYLLSSFAVDILAVLPFPQVVVLVVFQAMKGSHFPIAIRALKFILICQFFPRAFRVYSFLKKSRWSSGIFSNSARAKAIFNLFLYMLASHVFGAIWYLFSIERKATCLQVRCHSHPYCPQNYNNRSIERLCMDGCSGKASSSDIAAFDFGIFGDAFNSGIVYWTDFIWKFSYCFWWGLQNLSSLGQGLKTSTHIWEIYFAVSLTVSGLVLFALLIGNLQTILQAKSARLEEMRLKGDDIKLWTNYQKLPCDLKEQIKQHEKNKWLKTRGIDIAEVLRNLPKELRRQTTRHLCHDAIKSVPMFQFASSKFVDAICGCLKPVLHIAHNPIISEGELLEEVIFITKGKLLVRSKFNYPRILKEGDYFGEDLLNQVFKDPRLLTVVSTKTVYACTEVEAFVLSAKDLNNVINIYWWKLNQALSEDPTYKVRRRDLNYEEPWAAWAARVVQTKWRGNIEKRKKGKPQLSSAIESGNSQPSVAKNIHVFGFIHHVMKALSEKHKKKRRKRCKDMSGPSNNV